LTEWVCNQLVAKGDPARIREFLEAVKGEWGPFDFRRIISAPELIAHATFARWDLEEMDAVEWRKLCDWCVANWGTKWGAFDTQVDESTAHLGVVVIRFSTAWTPPCPILQRLQEMFGDIGLTCRWYPVLWHAERFGPDRAMAIARSEGADELGKQIVTTLYLADGEYDRFFLETRATKETGIALIEPLTEEEADRWLLAPETKLLALMYPQLHPD
jgi:hypothetical protein